MSVVPAGAERRQFGRRPSNILALAVLPGELRLACVIENLSDGGALLRFTAGATPTEPFRLVVEDTEFSLLCEIRHIKGRNLGVCFARLAAGIALNRHFHQDPSVRSAGDRQASRPLHACVPLSVREMRRNVLGLPGHLSELPAPPEPSGAEAADTRDGATGQVATVA